MYTQRKCENANNNNMSYDKYFVTDTWGCALQVYNATADKKVDNDQWPITDHHFTPENGLE